jgi:polyisoprenoid-binding protein YceI
MAALSSAVCAAGEAPAVPAAARYTQSANSGNLTFVFVQADAENKRAFRKFSTELVYDEKNLAAGKLDVTVQIASLDTQDKDRDDTLKGADLLDAAKHPTAHYSAASLVRTASGGIEAVGKLTLRGVTRDLRVPLTLRATAGGLEISGETTIRRLDFGVGQGEWQSTEWVGNDVKLQFKVPLSRAG